MLILKRCSSDLILSLSCLITAFFLAGCGDEFKPDISSTPQPINIVPTTAAENPKTRVGLDPSIALGTDGFLRIAYYDLSNGDLKFARCTDADCSTPVITILDSTGDVGASASLRIASDGFARISYYDASNGNLKFARCTDADCTTPALTAVDTADNVGASTALAIGSDGFARISYYDAGKGTLKFALCADADCAAATLTVIGPETGIGGAQSAIVLGADGFARISHWNLTSLNLDYVRCTNAACSTRNNITVDAAGTTTLGAGSSIRLGPDGFARISYFGEESVITENGVSSVKGQIKFAQCNSDDCTSPTLSIVDSSARYGQTTALEVAADGFARMAYYDQENAVLKFARCTDAACNTPLTTTVDATMDSGDFPSLVLGADDFAKIAYFHHTNGDLKLAQCTNADCTANAITTLDR